jgi:hypothetical protein
VVRLSEEDKKIGDQMVVRDVFLGGGKGLWEDERRP